MKQQTTFKGRHMSKLLSTRQSAYAFVAMIVLLCVESAGAQDITLTGMVSDSTKAVMPGVTVTAVHVDSGNTFTAVTDGAGVYRIGAMRPGGYRVVAELSGFSTITREGVEMLIGQRVVLDLQMQPSTVSESITVTGDAPLVDTTQSRVSGVIDGRQMEALPINGRNWLELTMLAPGSRVNAVGASAFGTVAGASQVNVDGQEINTGFYYATTPNPKFSREAIAEFEMVSARFEATQGRSRGIVVNVVTKSGTNTPSGSVYGYFRDDKFNAADKVAKRVLPYSNQQAGATYGGPIRRDKLHFFVSYEGEREPQTFITANPLFTNIPGSLATTYTQHLAAGRADWQMSPKMRLAMRANYYGTDRPLAAVSPTVHPSRATQDEVRTYGAFATLTRVWGQTVNEIKGGMNYGGSDSEPASADIIGTQSAPQINLRGYTLGSQSVGRVVQSETKYSIRDDWTTSRGSHELKLGGEVLLPSRRARSNLTAQGVIDATLGPITPAIAALFPVWNDSSTWNLAPLSAITRSYLIEVPRFPGGHIYCASPGNEPGDCTRNKPEYATWIQDNWRLTSKLTLNLGLRWDFALDAMVNDIDVPPIKSKTGQEWDKFGPRLGFAYAMTPKMVVRGGWGKYWAGATSVYATESLKPLAAEGVTVFNDGRPNFAADPFNIAGGGKVPTFEEAQRLATNRTIPPVSGVAVGDSTYSNQTSIGIQREVASSLSLQADYVWMHSGNERNLRNVNLTFDPVTGVNRPFSNPANRAFPQYGGLWVAVPDGYTNVHSLELGFTKRFSQRWQAMGTYTLSSAKDFINTWGLFPGCENVFTTPGSTDCSVPVTVPADYRGDYGPAAASTTEGSGQSADQRHRAVLNAIWELPYGFQVSSLYFYGSGERFRTQYGADVRDGGVGTVSLGRYRPDGTIMPRNALLGEPIHRVDTRVQKRLPLRGSIRADLQLEVFNVFNHANYGSYVTVELSPLYGQPLQNSNVAYQPRVMQLGVKVAF